MINLLHHQVRLLIGIEASKNVKGLPTVHHAEISKSSLHDLTHLQCLKTRPTLKKRAQLIPRDGLEFGQVVILRLARNAHSYLPQGANAVWISAIVSNSYFMSAGAIVNYFLLIAQVAKIRTNHWSELLVIADRLGGDGKTGTEKNGWCEETAT
jgi:hypothetical protein